MAKKEAQLSFGIMRRHHATLQLFEQEVEGFAFWWAFATVPGLLEADLDQLLAAIQEIEARDPCIAKGLRHLAAHFKYQKLIDLFGPAVPPVNF